MCGSGQSFCKKVYSLLFCGGVVYNYSSIFNMFMDPMEFDVDVRSTGSQERQTKQKQSQTKDQIKNVNLFKETNKVNICSRERNVRAVKRQLRCDRDKNKKKHKNSIFVEGNKDKIKSKRDKINIKKNRKRENNTRGKIQQRKGKEREREQ